MNDTKKRIIEENFFRPRWYSVFLNPYFINRNSIFRAIKDFSKNIQNDAEVLDIGCGLKPYENIFKVKKYIGIDIEGGGHADKEKRADAFYDGVHIPFPDNSFESVLCTQVLEHAENPEELIRECARVLKQNGNILISMPFIYPEHEKPYDFRRFTQFGHRKLLEKNNFSEIKISKTTGFWGTFGQLFVVSIFEAMTFKASLLKTFLSVILFGPIQIISLFLDFIFGRAGPTMDYIVTARKI